MFNIAISKIMSSQITNTILMVRPLSFGYNEQTAINNYYQKNLNLSCKYIQRRALSEFDNFVINLKKNGVNVIVIEDVSKGETPDSIFPNNWVSFHSNGDVALYPMYALNRRKERRTDVFDLLKDKYNFQISKIMDFSSLENNGVFLEGTGSMVFDRKNKICYAAISERTDRLTVLDFCSQFNYKPILFTAKQKVGKKRLEIYHTNVMMSVAESFAIICLDSIDNNEERNLVVNTLINSGKNIIEISESQKNNFAGNMLQVMGDQAVLVMSSTAYNSLSITQINDIKQECAILHSPLSTIEACGGGSARCMMAEIFLPKA